MLSLRPCRSVDAAAAQLTGATVLYAGDAELAAPLDLRAYRPIAAGRDAARAEFLIGALN